MHQVALDSAHPLRAAPLHGLHDKPSPAGGSGAADKMAAMPRVTFVDGREVELPEGEPIGSVLPPDAVAAKVGDRTVDLSWVPDGDVRVEAVPGAAPDGLPVLRHSAAHVMAQ